MRKKKAFVEDWAHGCGDVTQNDAVQKRIDSIRHWINHFDAKDHSETEIVYAENVCYLLNYITELEEQYEEAAAIAFDDETLPTD